MKNGFKVQMAVTRLIEIRDSVLWTGLMNGVKKVDRYGFY